MLYTEVCAPLDAQPTVRLLAPAAAIRRTIIRHLVLVLDLSSAMMDRDMRPTRFDLMLQYAREFVTEWFDQNPLGQIGVVGMRGGFGERIGEMSGMSCSCMLMHVLCVPAPPRQPARRSESHLGAAQARTQRRTKSTERHRDGSQQHEPSTNTLL